MYAIGLDISLHQTGYAVLNGGRVVYAEALKGDGDSNKMFNNIINKIRRAVSNVGKDNMVVVIEDYTKTLTSNDRTIGTAGKMKNLKDMVANELMTHNVHVAKYVTWSWRRHYGLPTRVSSIDNTPWSIKWSRIVGHNALKQSAVDMLAANAFRVGMTSDKVRGITDDEVEAILIANSYFLSGGLMNDSTKYFKDLKLSTDDIKAVANTLPKAATDIYGDFEQESATTWSGSNNKSKIWNGGNNSSTRNNHSFSTAKVWNG